jgi:uncharacterized protein (TIRG00374 family)
MNQSENKGTSLRRNLLVVIGSLLGLFFLYLAFRDITWNDLVNGIKQMQPIYLIPATILVICCQLIRALRFGVILSPFCRLGTKSLWDLLNIWAAANMIMPARLGELVRPYLLQRRGAPFSSSFGAVMVERFFDLSGLLLLLIIVLWTTPQIPPVYTLLGEVLLIMLVVGYVLVLVVIARREKAQAIVNRMLSVLPAKAATFLGGIFQRLIEGFGIMASFRQVLFILGYSIALWVFFSGVTYLFLLSFSINAPFLVAVTIQVLMALGVALPTAPGFIGTFHAVGRYSLALFGISAVVAVSFATVSHLFALITSLLLGLLSYATSNFRFDHKMFAGSSAVTHSVPDAVAGKGFLTEVRVERNRF